MSFKVSNRLNKINSRFGKISYRGLLKVSISIINATKEIIETKIKDRKIEKEKLFLTLLHYHYYHLN